MRVTLPVAWHLGAWLSVSRCETNAMGGTDVDASFAGVALSTMTFHGYDVAARGFDELAPRIESNATDQIVAALGLAQ